MISVRSPVFPISLHMISMSMTNEMPQTITDDIKYNVKNIKNEAIKRQAGMKPQIDLPETLCNSNSY